MDLTDGPGLTNCCGATTRDKEEKGRECLLDSNSGVGGLSSASSSSESSLHSTSSALLPVFLSNPPINTEEEKEMLSGCSKSFTGLKLFTRR